jgi:hypothetical protein
MKTLETGSIATFTSTAATSGPPGYRERSGWLVRVLRPLAVPDEVDPEVGGMYKIEFIRDGAHASVYADELAPLTEAV